MDAGTATLTRTLSPALQRVLARVTEINSLPEVTTRIVRVVEDPQSTAHDMHEIVKTDPALATKILRVVNSAFYGMPGQVASLDRAILLLGLSAVKNIALAASLARMFNAATVANHFLARDLWRHSVAVGVGARLLAEAGQEIAADEAFVAGLVHDLGLIVMLQLFPEEMKEIEARCLGGNASFRALEDSLVGADHQLFGDALAMRWGFPAGLRVAVACHHALDGLTGELRKIATLVHTADTLCAHAKYGFWLSARDQEIPGATWAYLNVSTDALDAVRERLPEHLEENVRVFAD